MIDPNQITFFAKTDARGQQVPFGIKANDRTRHVYVIGKTGMGKSTLLENMAAQDMKNGNGLAFIDPHGATAETLLNYVPEDRVKDVLYFAPFDTAHPISFNVMEDVGPDKRHLVVSGLMSVFKKIWVDAWSARMEYILSNTLLALLEYPESTLLGVNRMLSDKFYRKAVIDNITDPAVKSFWVDEFLNYNERYMQEAGDAIKNKIGQFTANPLIRNIIGQPHTSFDLRDMMDNRKILIANLSKGLVGESNANLLGSMLTTRIYLSAMSRADLSSQQLKEMPNFYFYVDEFQSFANATFADILSEARKYKLNLTIAHQYIEQMEEEVRNAVFGNVGTIIAFRVGPFDAEILETIFTPKFLAADIVNLGFAQIYLTLMIDGIGSQPFSAVTLPPIEPGKVSYKDMVIANSRAQYGKDRSGVEEKINAWHHQIFDEKKLAYEAEKARKIAAGELPPSAAGKHTPVVAPPKQTNPFDKSPRNDAKKPSQKPNRPPKSVASKPAPVNDRKPRQQSDRQNDGVKTAPKSPNLDELRNVLKTMVQKDDTKTPEPKPSSPKHNSQSANKNDTPNTSKVSATNPKKPDTKSSAQPAESEHKSALQAAVAAALGDTTNVEKKTSDEPKSAPVTVAVEPPVKVVEQQTPPAPAQTKSTDSPSEASNTPKTQPTAPSSINETLESNASTTPPLASHNNLDPKQLERMMRVSPHERNPFR